MFVQLYVGFEMKGNVVYQKKMQFIMSVFIHNTDFFAYRCPNFSELLYHLVFYQLSHIFTCILPTEPQPF